MRALALGIALAVLVAAPAVACGPTSTKPLIPPLGEAIDDLLPRAEIAKAEREKVAALRVQIGELAATGQKEAARQVEQQAMRILGYSKLWLHCGPGTFIWAKFS